jgi:hypothetical protein
MIKAILYISAALLFFGCNSSPKNKEPQQTNSSTVHTMKDYFPFEIMDDEQHSIVVGLGAKGLYPKYSDFFTKYGYEPNGDCWAGHIIQILEKEDAELISHIDFDPEAGAFFAHADSKENQLRFVNVLAPIFADINKLEAYVKVADRTRIDD